ncbi:NYN domain-containing protein [Patescibacteria group bacterium]|nr:NYN domain-containing protein [Patescibacteria group bacterium]
MLQAMIDRPNYNQAVIVSGDGDFASLVKHLNEQKKLATVIVPNERRYSGFLNEASGDKIVSLSLLKTTLRYKPSPQKKEGSAHRPPKQKNNTPRKELLQHTSKNSSKKPILSQQFSSKPIMPSPQTPKSPSQNSQQRSKSPAPAQRPAPQLPKNNQTQRPPQQNSKNNQAKQPPQKSQSTQNSKTTINN